MLGHLERDKVFDLISRSGVLLQLSRYEPFGLTVIEALATGTPVVVTPAVGSAEHLPAAVARVVAPGDISALAGAIDELLVTARSEDQRAACRAAASDFAPPVIAERLEAAFYDTLGMSLVTRPVSRDDVADQIVLLA
jgi:glycosyltransferase involved in cell wall biosynthesis